MIHPTEGQTHIWNLRCYIHIYLSLLNYQKAKNYGINFPDFETALKFSTESGLKGLKQRKEKIKYTVDTTKHFGWHGKRCTNADTLMDLKFQ